MESSYRETVEKFDTTRVGQAVGSIAEAVGQAGGVHPLRIIAILGEAEREHDRILQIDGADAADQIAEGVSPVMVSRTGWSNLQLVAYYMRKCEKLGLIQKIREERRRGAVEHFYALTELGQAAYETLLVALLEN